MKFALLALFSFLTVLIVSTAATAATIADLPARKMKMSGDGSRPAMIDLSSELSTKSLGQNDQTSRLVRVELKIKAGFTGATLGLMMNGVAVSSSSVLDDQEQTLTLTADSNTTPPPWILAVRGEVQILEMRLTMDAATSAPDPIPTAPTNPQPEPTPEPIPTEPVPTEPAPTPEEPEQPKKPAQDELVGQRVIIVSKSTGGTIDYALIVSKEENDTYTVVYKKREIRGFLRRQIGLISGCSGNICVGDKMSYFGTPVLILGRLNNGLFVTEQIDDGTRLVLSQTELTAQTSGDDTVPVQPSPEVPTPRRYYRGESVLIVGQNSKVSDGTILGSSGSAITVTTENGVIKIKDQTRIAVFEGCAGDFCVGQNVSTRDRKGIKRYGQITAIQSSSLVVLRILQSDKLVGNWPVQSLRR
jgi:hypothetical protein